MAMASKMIYDAVQSMDGCFGAVTCAVFVQCRGVQCSLPGEVESWVVFC